MTTPFLGMIELFPFGFAPKGWALCNGQLLAINQNQALFSLLGTTYGGDGIKTFALPNLQGGIPISVGSGFALGQAGGEASHTLTKNELPTHSHTLMADAKTAATSNTNVPTGNVLGQTTGITNPGSGSPQTYSLGIYSGGTANGTLQPPPGAAGQSTPHENRMPFLALSYCIALQGIFPSQN